jgi:hypothetical protein
LKITLVTTNLENILNQENKTGRPPMSMKSVYIAGPLLIALFVVSTGSLRSAEDQKPPAVYIDKGACPFECCTYREWVARTDVTFVDVPDGKVVVGQIKKGEKVLALTGEIHSVPLPIVARKDYPVVGVKAGDTIYLLHYVGEGSWKVWHMGNVFEIDDLPGKVPKPKTTCWVKLKTSSGVIGWTIDQKNFENQDACG